MVQRIRRAREAFEKKDQGFPRTGLALLRETHHCRPKKKEDMELAHAQTLAAAPETRSNRHLWKLLTASVEPTQPAGSACTTAPNDTAAWWAALRAHEII